MKRRILTASAAAIVALTALSTPSQALVSQTNATQNEHTDAIAQLKVINKNDLEQAKNNAGGSNVVSVKATICTASLISPEWMIGAGHCVKDGMDNIYTEVTFGVNKSSDKKYVVTQAVTHPQGDDIALFKLNKPVEGATPMKLWDSVIKEDTAGVAYGWGRTKGSNSLETLNTLNGTMHPKFSYGGPFPDMPTNPVTFDGGHSATGDSGSPFIINNAIHGVLSMGTLPKNDGDVRQGLYMPVANYQDWIKATIQSDDSFINTPGTTPGDAQSQTEDKAPIDAEVPAEDVPTPVDEDVTSNAQGSTVSGNGNTTPGSSQRNDHNDNDTQNKTRTKTPSSTTPSPTQSTPGVSASISAQGSMSVQRIPQSTTKAATPVKAGDKVGPKVNTGGQAQSQSFFQKIWALL